MAAIIPNVFQTPAHQPIEAAGCPNMKRGPRFALLDEKSHTAKKCRREIFPESEEAATDVTKITCIDAAIDTGDVTVLLECLDNGLSPDGCGGYSICCGGSHIATLIKLSGKGSHGPLGNDPMSLVGDDKHLQMLMLLIDRGADLNKQAYRGETNADRGTAAHYVQSAIALYILMVAGADMNATIRFNGALVSVQKYLAWTDRGRLWARAHKAFLAKA